MSKKYTFTMVVVKPTGKGGKPLKPKPIKPKNKSTGGSIEKVPGGYSKEGSGRISDKGLKGRSPSQAFSEKEKRMENTKPQGMTKKMGVGMMKKYNKGGEMLKGGQRKLDKNKDGKISGEDFKLIRREKPEMKPLKAREGKMVKTPDGKMSEDKYSKYVRSIKLAEPKDIRNIVKKKSMGGDTSTEGNIKHGKLKSQKELKKITDSKEYKDSDYEQKTKMLNTATMNKGGEMKRGYGAARQSGMGLQDENLQPGKSMDYYKDLI